MSLPTTKNASKMHNVPFFLQSPAGIFMVDGGWLAPNLRYTRELLIIVRHVVYIFGNWY